MWRTTRVRTYPTTIHVVEKISKSKNKNNIKQWGNQSLFNKFIKYYIGYLSPFSRKKTIQQELNSQILLSFGADGNNFFCATYGDLSFRGTDKLALLYSILFERLYFQKHDYL